MESTSEMETALQFYEAARDNLSLVRVYCYCGNLEKVSCACRIRLQSISAKRGANAGFYFHAKPILRERVFASRSTSVERLQGPSGILVFCTNFSSLKFFYIHRQQKSAMKRATEQPHIIWPDNLKTRSVYLPAGFSVLFISLVFCLFFPFFLVVSQNECEALCLKRSWHPISD